MSFDEIPSSADIKAAHAQQHAHTHTHTNTHKHTHSHTFTRAHKHTHIHTQRLSLPHTRTHTHTQDLQRRFALDRVAELKYEVLPQLERELAHLSELSDESHKRMGEEGRGAYTIVGEVVGVETIRTIVSRSTGIGCVAVCCSVLQ